MKKFMLMQKTSQKNITDILNTSKNSLQNILAKAAFLQKLTERVRNQLDSKLASQCVVVNLHEGNLVILVPNGACATQLRFQIPDLLKNLRTNENLPGLIAIQCIVRPQENMEMENDKKNTEEIHSNLRKPFLPSKASAKMIIEASNLIQNEKLAAALQQLGEGLEELCAREVTNKLLCD